MTDLTINALSKEYPSLDESTGIDFGKTVYYISSYTSLDMGIIEKNCPSSYQASNLLLRKAQFLYRNKDITWVEAIAAFEELHAECLLKDRKSAVGIFAIALRILKWMSEGSDYLQSVYKDEAEQKREEMYRQMDNLQLKIEACEYVADKKGEFLLERILYRLKVSRSLWHAEKEVRRIVYFLSYDTELLSNALPLIIDLIHELIVAGRIDKSELLELCGILKKRVQTVDDNVSDVWYTGDRNKIHPILTNAIQLHAFLYLVSKETGATDSDLAVIAARICRYLSCIPSIYSDVLKNKSYTLLTGENRLNGRIRWDSLCNFDEKSFLDQLVTIQIEDSACNTYEQVAKCQQYSNASNTLTLDNDGFTLSTLCSPHSWKGRKDRVSVLNNRLFVSLFSKPVCPFESCKTIKDYRLYWNQLARDFPLSSGENKRIGELFSDDVIVETTKKPMPEFSGSRYPAPGEKVSIRVLLIQKETMSLCVEIISDPYRGIRARLPFAYINSCYSMIPGFDDLFSVNQLFQAKVKESDKGEIILSLIQDYNEFIYPECVRKKTLLGMVVEIRDRKVWWLLSSGATATTSQTGHKKYQIGDIFKIEYVGLLSLKLKNDIKVLSHVARPDKDAFNQSVLGNIRDFIVFLTKEIYRSDGDSGLSSELKNENNPFFVALKDMNLEDVIESSNEIKEETEDVQEEGNKTVPIENTALSIELVHELIYCIDSLALDLKDSTERFNVV